MAKKQQPKSEPKKVYCAECRHFRRDTEGRSRTVDGEYFMGICLKGLTPDSPKKQFADKPRVCNTYQSK
jgi:hypothetical protein